MSVMLSHPSATSWFRMAFFSPLLTLNVIALAYGHLASFFGHAPTSP